MASTIEQSLQQGVAAHKEGKLEEAERHYRAILQSQPLHPDANHNLGLIAISVNRADAALPLFKTALEANPKVEQFWLSCIDALIKDQQFENAKQVLEQAKKQCVAGEKLNVLEAQLASISEPEKVGSKNPSQARIDSLLKHYQDGRFSEAEKLALSITQEFPRYQFGWKVLGALFKQTGRVSESLAASQNSVQLEPQDAEAHSNLGNTLQVLGRLGEAEVSYTQAIALKPDYAEAHNNLGITLKDLDRLDEAEASFRQAIALQPEFAQAHRKIWLVLFDQKQYEAALRDADLCISKGAIELDLTTLYALGRIEEIYKRIEIKSKIDGENISIAAFSTFVAESENKQTTYNFCPNPIDFIHVSNLSSHLKDSTAYITEVIEELDKINTIWEPFGKTTKSGFQTSAGMNLFKNPSGSIAQLKSIIIAELDAYYSKFNNEFCSYIQKWPSMNNLRGWYVVLKQQGYQGLHIHPGGWLSGVIYLKVVPSLGKGEGAIEFSLNGKNYSNINSPKLTYQPELVSIVFFPSSLHHRTIPYTTDTDRIIVSFDLIPEATRH